MESTQYVKKAKEFMFRSQSLNAASAPAFWQSINDLLAAGWDVFASQSIGLDTGGGQGGGGNIMMVVTLVKYEFLTLSPVAPANA